MTISHLPSPPDFYVISLRHNDLGQACGINREPVIGWYCDNDWAAVPMTPRGTQTRECALLQPDGSVIVGEKKFVCLDAWFGKEFQAIRDEQHCAYKAVSAQPGYYVLEGCLDDESRPPRYDVLKTPVISFNFGADGVVYPGTTEHHVYWGYSTLVEPDGTVRNYEQTWPSVEAWAAEMLELKMKAKATRSPRGKA
jgi:hypothetical protein